MAPPVLSHAADNDVRCASAVSNRWSFCCRTGVEPPSLSIRVRRTLRCVVKPAGSDRWRDAPTIIMIMTDPTPVLASEPALFVDLDGTLLRTDMLWESFTNALRFSPMGAMRGVAHLADGRAALKQSLAQASSIDASMLPYHEPFLEWIREEAARGRRVFLATATDEVLAEKIADYLKFFAGIIASDGEHNRKGKSKLEAIRELIGAEPFDYCGNGREDLPIFAEARRSIVVAAAPDVLRSAQVLGNVDRVFVDHKDLSAWLRAIRPYQWLKNLLMFVPLLTAFKLGDPHAVSLSVFGFAAFCLAASGGYLVNDILDLQVDRRHPRKRLRPLASGDISIGAGLIAACFLVIGSLALASYVSADLTLWMLVYLACTFSYSLRLKRTALFDIAMLAMLYTCRILAGGAAIGVKVSFWLLAFSAFIFFSLALVKRCGELVALRDRQEDTAGGRAYMVQDLAVLQPLGIATTVCSVLVFALFVSSPETVSRYPSPGLLWLSIVALMLWLARIWLVANRGGMHDDPLIFAISNRMSLVLLSLMLLGFAAAATLP